MAKNPNLDKVVISFTQLSAAFVSFILANSLITLVADLFFPRAIVLGNNELSAFAGLLYSMLLVSIIAVGVMPVVEYLANLKGAKLTNLHWLLFYWLVNAGAIWLAGRFAAVIGFGIRSWLVAVMLGLAFNLAQGTLMTEFVSRVKSQ